jgi:hypothetical protein
MKVFKKDQAKLVHRVNIGDKFLVISEDNFYYRNAFSYFTPESLQRYREHCDAATAWCRANLGMAANGKGETVYRGRKTVGYPVNPKWRVISRDDHHEYQFFDENQAFLFKFMFG